MVPITKINHNVCLLICLCLCMSMYEQTQQIKQSTAIKSSAIKQTQTGTSAAKPVPTTATQGSFGLRGNTSSGPTSNSPGSPTTLPRRPQPPARRLRPGRPPPSASRQIQGPTPTSSAPAQASLPSTERLGRLKLYVCRYAVWVPYYLFPLSPEFINMGDSGEIGHSLPLLRRRHTHCSPITLVYCSAHRSLSLRRDSSNKKNKLFTVSRSL